MIFSSKARVLLGFNICPARSGRTVNQRKVHKPRARVAYSHLSAYLISAASNCCSFSPSIPAVVCSDLPAASVLESPSSAALLTQVDEGPTSSPRLPMMTGAKTTFNEGTSSSCGSTYAAPWRSRIKRATSSGATLDVRKSGQINANESCSTLLTSASWTEYWRHSRYQGSTAGKYPGGGP